MRLAQTYISAPIDMDDVEMVKGFIWEPETYSECELIDKLCYADEEIKRCTNKDAELLENYMYAVMGKNKLDYVITYVTRTSRFVAVEC